ncbi:MAG: inverse autotransporter beta domain-containing protein [Planctomycetaceae bacterium]|nr:inverse autotransporter beta domain-containing protein [Planctomycetaceae bacterium]
MNHLRMFGVMPPSRTRTSSPGKRYAWRFAAALWACGVALIGGGNATGADGLQSGHSETFQVTGAESHAGRPAGVDFDFNSSPPHEIPGGGVGFLTRIGHIAGETIGRDDSITHVGLAPYVFVEESMFFGDLRMYRTNEGRTGGNAGMGWRHYLTNQDSIFGVAGYYDNDDSRGARFHQLGLSLEYLTRWFDARVNWYVPIETKERVVRTSIVEDSERFEGHFLLFDRRTDLSTAADGVDLLLSTPIPGEIPEAFNWEVSAGAYHYQARGSDLQKIWGWRLRSDADLFKRILHMFVDLTHDDVTDTNIVFGASLNYYHGFENQRRLHDSQFYRMSEWVRRNYTVVTIDDFVINEGEVARNPDTGDPYYFAHVRNIPGAPEPPPLPTSQPPFYNFPSPFGDGTVDMPYQFIQEAQAFLQGSAPIIRDNGVIYVHGNSVYNGSDAVVVMNDGEIILGEGAADEVFQTLPVFGFAQPVTLPTVIPNGALPQLNGATGDAVTAASDVLFGGFNITNPLGNGITIDTQIDGMFRDLRISGAGGDGVLMTGVNTGVYRFDRVTINDATGVGFHVDGGSAQITVADPDNVTLGTPTITNLINEAILIENTTGGFVNFAQTLVEDDGGAGIRLINNLGAVTLGMATLTNTGLSTDPNSVGAGLEITGSGGNTTLLENITIVNPLGPGLLVHDLLAGGSVNTSGNIVINSRNNVGADFDNIDGTVQFGTSSSLSIGTPGAGADATHPGIRFHNGSSGSVILNNFSVAGSPAEGILIGDPTGAQINSPGAVFRVLGIGTLSNTTGPALHIRGANGAKDPTAVDMRGSLISNSRIGRGVHIEDTSGVLAFPGSVVINNNAAVPSGFAALFIDDVTAAITFGSFTSNNAVGGEPDVFEPLEFEPAVDIQNVAAPASVNFNNLNILDTVGTDALDVDNTNRFVTNVGNISVVDGQAIEIDSTTINVALNSVSSSNSPDFGISVVDSPGSFRINGDGSTLTSGGTITGAGIIGALFDNTDEVTLRFQDYTANGDDPANDFVDGNGAAIVAVNMIDDGDFLFMEQMQISNNFAQGVYTRDVREVIIQDSTFMDNGAAGVLGTQQHIHLTVFTNPNDDDLLPTDPNFDFFQYTIRRNLFFDTVARAGDDVVFVQTVGANAENAGLEFFFLNNTIQSMLRGQVVSGGVTFRPAGLEVNWNGTLAANVLTNTINMLDEDGQTGIRMVTQGLTTRANINVNDNAINGSGNGDDDNLIGIDFDLLGPANVTVARNAIDLVSTFSPLNFADNIGMRFRFLDGNKNVDIIGNRILMDQGTGMSFPFVASPVTSSSSFFIQGNQIGSATRIPTQGIIMSNITGVLRLSGNVDNIVFSQTGNFFVAPANNILGGIFVNGVFVP